MKKHNAPVAEKAENQTETVTENQTEDENFIEALEEAFGAPEDEAGDDKSVDDLPC